MEKWQVSAFQRGDRVRYRVGHDGIVEEGDCGTVVDIVFEEDQVPFIAVDWDRDVGGWDCNGNARDGHGYYVYEDDLGFEFDQDYVDRELDCGSVSELFETL